MFCNRDYSTPATKMWLIRLKIGLLEWVTFQLHDLMLSSFVIKKLWTFFRYWPIRVEIALNHCHVDNYRMIFSGKILFKRTTYHGPSGNTVNGSSSLGCHYFKPNVSWHVVVCIRPWRLRSIEAHVHRSTPNSRRFGTLKIENLDRVWCWHTRR